MRKEVAPKNILMIGPTGVGKTEIARRLAPLTGAPFIKVEATKYTEVGYYGRDVESMVRELVENAIGLVRERELASVEEEAKRRVDERLLDLLAPAPTTFDVGVDSARLARALRADPRKDAGDARGRRAGESQGRDRDRAKGPGDDDPRHGRPGRTAAWTSTSRACSKRSCPRTSAAAR